MDVLRNFKAIQEILRYRLAEEKVLLQFFHGAQDHRHIHVEIEAKLPCGKIKPVKYLGDLTIDSLDNIMNNLMDIILEGVLMELKNAEE